MYVCARWCRNLVGYLYFLIYLRHMLSSPSGKLVQIEHALTAVGSGQTSLGIKGNGHSALSALF